MKPLYQFLFITVLLTGLFACKKTIDFERITENRITAFTVINVKDTVIYGAIDNIQNSITVYVPFYYSLSVIEPKITVDQGASLLTAIVPVNVADDKQTYQVKAANGQVRTYSLKIVQQNPVISTLNWLSANNAASPNTAPYVQGNIQSTSTATLDVTLTQQGTNKTFKTDLSQASIVNPYNQDTYIMSLGLLPADLDSGYYKVEISLLGNKIMLDTALHVVYVAPSIAFKSHEVKQGQTITITPYDGTVFIDLKSVKLTFDDGKVVDIPVVSYNRLSATLKIPDNVPVAENWYGKFEFTFGKWDPFNEYIRLTVTPK